MPRGGPGALLGCTPVLPVLPGRAAQPVAAGLPWAFACTRHRVLPCDTCPGCRRVPREYAGAARLNPPGGRASSITPGSCCRTDLTAVPAQRRAASACPREVENADQTGGFIDREYDEPEIANVGDPPSRHSGRRAEHRVVRVVAGPGQQRHEHVERLVRKAAHLPERAGLQVRPAAHAWVRRSRM